MTVAGIIAGVLSGVIFCIVASLGIWRWMTRRRRRAIRRSTSRRHGVGEDGGGADSLSTSSAGSSHGNENMNLQHNHHHHHQQQQGRLARTVAVGGMTPPPAVVRMQRHANAAGLLLHELDGVAPAAPFVPSQRNPNPAPDDAACPICLDDMDGDSKARRLPCDHAFHAECIEEWVTKANRCPICNTHVIDHAHLRKSRAAALQGVSAASVAESTTSRQRRRRTRGENGTFELRDGNAGSMDAASSGPGESTSSERLEHDESAEARAITTDAAGSHQVLSPGAILIVSAPPLSRSE